MIPAIWAVIAGIGGLALGIILIGLTLAWIVLRDPEPETDRPISHRGKQT
jgi:hypothetical protein